MDILSASVIKIQK